MSRRGLIDDIDDDAERLRFLDEILSELRDLAEDHIILIEGNKDRKALEALIGDGFESIEVQREGGPLAAAERVAASGRGAVILTDWDARGGRLAADLESYLRADGTEFDTSVRRRLSSVCRKDIKDVEALDSLYERLSSAVR